MHSSWRRPLGSNRQRSTRSACSEKSPKLTPSPSQVAPSGYGLPGQTAVDGFVETGLVAALTLHRVVSRGPLRAVCHRSSEHRLRLTSRSRLLLDAMARPTLDEVA